MIAPIDDAVWSAWIAVNEALIVRDEVALEKALDVLGHEAHILNAVASIRKLHPRDLEENIRRIQGRLSPAIQPVVDDGKGEL